MNILSIENLSKTVNDEPLFDSVTLGLDEGEKAGIVGKNGAGKSTFLKTIAGIIVPDDGKVSMKNGTNMFYLPQEITFSPGSTVESFFYESDNPVITILSAYRKASEDGDTERSSGLFEEIEKKDLWEAERRYEGYLGKLGMNEDRNKRMADLSGGEQKKTAIARALAVSPDLLLLDQLLGYGPCCDDGGGETGTARTDDDHVEGFIPFGRSLTEVRCLRGAGKAGRNRRSGTRKQMTTGNGHDVSPFLHTETLSI